MLGARDSVGNGNPMYFAAADSTLITESARGNSNDGKTVFDIAI